MTATHFTLDNTASNGTSNLNYLLSADLQSKLRSFTPAMIETHFGPGSDLCFDQSRGYTDPEWYWHGSNGCIWGIGWRWGAPRLRGRGAKQKNQSGPFWVHPREEDAAEFVNFLARNLSS